MTGKDDMGYITILALDGEVDFGILVDFTDLLP